MRTKCFRRLAIGMSLCCFGCTVPWEVTRTLVVEPAQFPRNIDHNALCLRAHRLAEKAWTETQGSNPSHCEDYRKGFVFAYSDYLQHGGSGEPPPVPPRCYWAQDTIAGRQAAVEWFAGFREGAKLAHQSGLRELILIPTTGGGSLTENTRITNAPHP